MEITEQIKETIEQLRIEGSKFSYAELMAEENGAEEFLTFYKIITELYNQNCNDTTQADIPLSALNEELFEVLKEALIEKSVKIVETLSEI